MAQLSNILRITLSNARIEQASISPRQSLPHRSGRPFQRFQYRLRSRVLEAVADGGAAAHALSL